MYAGDYTLITEMVCKNFFSHFICCLFTLLKKKTLRQLDNPLEES